MKVEYYIPSGELQSIIKTFIIIESNEGMVNSILPDTSLVMAFRFKGAVSDIGNASRQLLPSSVITGIRKSSRVIEYSRATANLLVVFRETGAGMLFNQPLHELSGSSYSLDNFFPASSMDDLEEQLSEAPDNYRRIACIEQFLLSFLLGYKPDALVQAAIDHIKSVNGVVRIQDLAGSLHISRDPFEKRFRRVTGSTPKQFARIVRLRHLIDHFPQTKSLTDAAYTAGYFDQAHFIKDFRVFTGQTPRHFFGQPRRW